MDLKESPMFSWSGENTTAGVKTEQARKYRLVCCYKYRVVMWLFQIYFSCVQRTEKRRRSVLKAKKAGKPIKSAWVKIPTMAVPQHDKINEYMYYKMYQRNIAYEASQYGNVRAFTWNDDGAVCWRNRSKRFMRWKKALSGKFSSASVAVKVFKRTTGACLRLLTFRKIS